MNCAALLLALVGMGAEPPPARTVLGVEAQRFTVNGQPRFLCGISYYGALGAEEATLRRDLDAIQNAGFNWIRVWATWAAFGADVSAVDGEGRSRDPFLDRLQRLVAECDRRGVLVDVTLSRGNGVTGAPRLQTRAAHTRAVETLVTRLQDYRNWYLDLSNERNIADRRHTSFADLQHLRAAVRQLDAQRLVTASHAGDLTREDVREYLVTVGVDFLTPHRPRHRNSPQQTAAKTREYLAWMESTDRRVPIHYQEPFRRGFAAGRWEPQAEDFIVDLQQALSAGAAGWCFHNGDHRDTTDGQPRRSFDMRTKPLWDQLDAEETKVVAQVRQILQ
jgi:hypothetical protein